MAEKKVRELSIEQMLDMRREGVTLQELANRLGVSRQRVQQLLGPTRAIIPHKVYPTREEREAARTQKKVDKFWSLVKIAAPDECWEWQGNINDSVGYGVLSFNGKHVYSHRLAHELTNGKIPDGMHILHSCDIPRCCNPALLRIGTPQENVKDRDNRKRNKPRCGSNAFYRNRNKEIVEQYDGTTGCLKSIADRYGIGTQMVYTVVRRYRNEQW